MIRGGIFRRTFSALMLITLLTVFLFTAVLAATLQAQQQRNFEVEVFRQAQEVADYMAHLDTLHFVRENTTMQYIVRKKIGEIHDRYNADVWIVSFGTGYGYVQYLDGNWNTSEGLATEAVLHQLNIIHQGKTIRATGLFPELGKDIVTLGVPWRYSNGDFVGAVLLHISPESLKVNLLSVLPTLLPSAAAVLLLGAIFSVLLARSQTRPIREINSAVTDFSKGNLDRRVELHCGGELEKLGESINRMAFELASLEESRKSFVASVSHELRSPLTCIQGYVQALSDGTIPPEEQQRYYKVVLDETARLSNLVHDLLELSRIESGKFPLNITRFDICESIRLALLSFFGKIEEKTSNVSIDLPDEAVFVSADEERIRQVLNNLIDNALKFLHDGKRLFLSVYMEEDHAVVRIADEGDMIPPEDLPFIFDRFYKVDKAHTSGKGTGLGLSIVKRILDQHGCPIEAASDERETVFTFSLPLAGQE